MAVVVTEFVQKACARVRGLSKTPIMNQTGRKSVTVTHRYIREGSLFRENAAAAVGL